MANTSAERAAGFLARDDHSKSISTPAVFELVDPRLHSQLDLLLTRYWDSARDMQGAPRA